MYSQYDLAKICEIAEYLYKNDKKELGNRVMTLIARLGELEGKVSVLQINIGRSDE